MDPNPAHTNATRAAGALLGFGLALALLLVSLPGAASSPLPATARFSVLPVGELEVDPPPPGAFLVAGSLRPGGKAASGDFQLRNQTGAHLAVKLRARPDVTSLDGLLRVRVRVGGRDLAGTTLQGLGERPVELDLASGQRVSVRLWAWIPKEVLNGYEGRLVHVSLVPEVRVIGGRR